LAAVASVAEAGLVSPDARACALGLARVRWPGRLEILAEGPRLVIDCAHNPAAIEALCESLPELGAGEVFLLFGALEDKDAAAMLRQLVPRAERIWLVVPPSARAAQPEALRPFAPSARVERDLAVALAQARAAACAA